MSKNPNRVRAARLNAQKQWPRVCKRCQAAFLGTTKQIFCCRECKESFELVPREPRPCEQCGNAVAARKGQRFCSEDCKANYHREARRTRVGTTAECRHCKGAFTVKAAAEWYCSDECRTVAASQKKYEKTNNPAAQLAQAAKRLKELSDDRNSQDTGH